jgi:MFS family permease
VGVNMGKTLSVANIQTKLTREQKEAVGLLSIGTFLEYFDLMLYVHMAVLLNELFFPKTDPFMASLLSAFAFCSTYLLRPFGALIFGWIGDRMGRKFVIITTTFLMAVSCTIMATAPTYAEIGITASVIITICRMLQGMSSMGEKIGAEVYLTENFKPPSQYPIVASIDLSSSVGTMSALMISAIMTSRGFNWRYAFGIGAIVAVIGFVARSTLKESAEFLKARTEQKNLDAINEKINKKTILAFFFMHCASPVWLYLIYVYTGDILKNSFGYTTTEIIQRNLFISILELFSCAMLVFLSTRFYPLKILKTLFFITSVGVLIFGLFSDIKNINHILYFQLFITLFSQTICPATPIVLKNFPILKRFTAVSIIYALSRASMYIIISFGFVYLVKYFDYAGLLMVIIPMLIGYYWGLRHFENLEKKIITL